MASGWYTTKADDINRLLWGSFQEGDIKVWSHLWRNCPKYRGTRTIVAANPGLILYLTASYSFIFSEYQVFFFKCDVFTVRKACDLTEFMLTGECVMYKSDCLSCFTYRLKMMSFRPSLILRTIKVGWGL